MGMKRIWKLNDSLVWLVVVVACFGDAVDNRKNSRKLIYFFSRIDVSSSVEHRPKA